MLLFLLACVDDQFGSTHDVGEGELTCPQDRPEAYAVTPDDTCLAEPTVGTFTPEQEWEWRENPIHPGYDDIMATPAIADLDGDGIPDVVFAAFSGGAYTSPGALVAIAGDGSGTLWSVTSAGGVQPYGTGGVGLGDLDGDGQPDVCVAAVEAAVLCVRHNGEFLWAAGSETYTYGTPNLADLDADGQPEVVFGRQVFAHDGTLVGLGQHGIGGRSWSFAVDMDADGQLEVVAGNAVYERDGTTVWADGGHDGVPAVADFDDDGRPDVIKVGSGLVTLTANDGTRVWEEAVPGGGSGGPPTIADFDGDGEPEVGVAGQAYYSLYDTDGSVLWSNEVSDYSSSVTGSSVFDFEGDGDAEVVYADEHTLWIFEGSTGEVLLAQDGHASGTLLEYPLIADVDADGTTEIVVASNDYAREGWNGITVLGDAHASWAPARPVWNQAAYHITNVHDDGSIPQLQQANWDTWNSFRAAGTPEGPEHWLSNLAVGDQEQCLIECDAGAAQVWVAVENTGLRSVEHASVSIWRDWDLLDEKTAAGTEPGEITWAGPFVINEARWGEQQLRVELAGPEGLEECDLTDNSGWLGEWPCD